jgi:hypothetical protein
MASHGTNHNIADRRCFIGGSDARIIVGNDEAALLRLWREKQGEVEPEDLSGNLIVQLGRVTEELNRRWYQVNTGQVITDMRRYFRFRFVLKRTPNPPPSSSMNSIPAASIACCIFPRASLDTRGPNPASKRLTVGRDRPARAASSDWDQPSRPRAARSCSIVTTDVSP